MTIKQNLGALLGRLSFKFPSSFHMPVAILTIIMIWINFGLADIKEAGTVYTEPSSDFVITEGQAFEFQMKYCPGKCGLGPGTALQIIPPQHLPRFPYERPRVSILAEETLPPLELVINPFHSSKSYKDAGSTEKIMIRFPQGLESGQCVRFSYPINIWPNYYDRKNPNTTTVKLALIDSGGQTMSHFTSPIWKMKTSKPQRMLLTCPSQAAVGEKISIPVAFVSDHGNPVYEAMGNVTIHLPEGACVSPSSTITFSELDRGLRHVEVIFAIPGIYRLHAISESGFETTSNPIRVTDKPKSFVLWGNLHTHSIYSWDARNWALSTLGPRDLIVLARELYLLDFIALTDHGQHDCISPVASISYKDHSVPQCDMTLGDWQDYNNEIISCKVPGIISYVGYEHRDERGDTCMIFRNQGKYFIENGRRLNAKEVWERCRPGELLSIPHFHPLSGIKHFNSVSVHETLAEIYSTLGAYEFYENPMPDIIHLRPMYQTRPYKPHSPHRDGPYVRDLLDRGFCLGLVAGEDHGQPGQSGITAAIVQIKGRDAIFDSLLARRTYATTGARMLIDFEVGGVQMGNQSNLEPDDGRLVSRDIKIIVHAVKPIQSVMIIRNGEQIFDQSLRSLDWEYTHTDKDQLPLIQRSLTGKKTAYYYLKVIQEDGEIAWTSPIFFVAD